MSGRNARLKWKKNPLIWRFVSWWMVFPWCILLSMFELHLLSSECWVLIKGLNSRAWKLVCSRSVCGLWLRSSVPVAKITWLIAWFEFHWVAWPTKPTCSYTNREDWNYSHIYLSHSNSRLSEMFGDWDINQCGEYMQQSDRRPLL